MQLVSFRIDVAVELPPGANLKTLSDPGDLFTLKPAVTCVCTLWSYHCNIRHLNKHTHTHKIETKIAKKADAVLSKGEEWAH